jgi:beta-lactamase regulating signal transducer with metallopeptidase domain
MFAETIYPHIPSLLVSTFMKGLALLAVAAIVRLGFKKFSSRSKHLLWLTLLFSVILVPVCSFFISPDFLPLRFQSGSPSEALRILDAIMPRYDGFGVQTGSGVGPLLAAGRVTAQGLLFPWSAIGVVLWMAGAVVSLARVIIGKIGVVRIQKERPLNENTRVTETLRHLTSEFGIRRKVQVLTTASCRVPFTYGTFKPVILLPPIVDAWPLERLHAVLLHELAHVKRIDSVTQTISRVVCSLFWFLPVVWIAHQQLYAEQEKACDECAVGAGIEAARYVRHMLQVVKAARGRVFSTGICMTRGKRKMLEKRILHVLRTDAVKFLTGKKVFFSTAALCLLLLVPILVINPVFAEDMTKKVSERDFWKALSGTWVNTEYLGTYAWFEQKVIIYPDGKWECYHLTTDTNPSRQGYYLTITEAWTDSEGVMWAKSTEEAGATRYQLSRVSESGNTWEFCDGPDTYPTEVDKSLAHYMYIIRYRR